MVGGDGKPTSSFGLVNRMFPHLTPGGNIKAAFPPPPSPGSSSGRSSGESGDAASGSRSTSVNLSADPKAFAYKLQESDSASSLGSLADKVAEFVEPERVPEKIPHKATGKKQNTKNPASSFPWIDLIFSPVLSTTRATPLPLSSHSHAYTSCSPHRARVFRTCASETTTAAAHSPFPPPHTPSIRFCSSSLGKKTQLAPTHKKKTNDSCSSSFCCVFDFFFK